jgi:glucarate dehydratase
MRISDIRATRIAFSDPPLRNSWGVHEPYALRTIVQVFTDDGIVGLGEAHGGAEIIEQRRLELLGLDPFQLSVLRQRAGGAYAVLETACLDIIGKAIGRPVCDLLGGKMRDEVPFSAYLFYKLDNAVNSGVEFADLSPSETMTPEAMLRQAMEFVQKFGFHALKLKGGVLPPHDEIESLQLMNDFFGEDVRLRIDPNAAWTVETSIKACAEMERRNLCMEYVEDPTPGQDGMAAVQATKRFPLATNMCVTRFDHLGDGYQKKAVKVVLVDHHAWGGLVACMQVARVCEGFGWGVSMHSNSHLGISLAAMTHLGAAIPNLDYACDSHYPWANVDVVNETFRFVDGKLRVSDAPGLGVSLDEDALARLAEVRIRYGREKRDDATEMRRFVPDWSPKLPRW